MSSHQKSTIVRAFRVANHRLIRAAFRMLELVAPGLAARWATRLWCTPPHAPRARHRDPEAVPGERFMTALAASPDWATRPVWRPRLGKHVAVPVAGRGMVVAEAWGEGPITYLVHGWGGRRTQLAAFVEPLVAAGQRVVALDALGHGESGSGRLGGRRTTLLEVAEALDAVVKVTGPAHAIIAHSGGGAATALAVQDGLPADRLVFIAPFGNPMPYLRHFARLLGLGRRGYAGLVRRLERLIDSDMAVLDAPTRAAATEPGRLPPLLVIHDRNDREVSHADGRAYAESWPGATLLTTEGLGHRRLLTDPAVVDAAVEFVTQEPAGPESRERSDRAEGWLQGGNRRATRVSEANAS
jgi:pimeloyl-ACP methyl ester carboxylesterase